MWALRLALPLPLPAGVADGLDGLDAEIVDDKVVGSGDMKVIKVDVLDAGIDGLPRLEQFTANEL